MEKVVVVTGANAGLGLALSLKLARMGARVVMACRSLERAERASARVLREVPGALATMLPLDLAEPESIREFGALFADRIGHLDILINNAGVFGAPLSRNSAGHDGRRHIGRIEQRADRSDPMADPSAGDSVSPQA